jgi:hypothetical protein
LKAIENWLLKICQWQLSSAAKRRRRDIFVEPPEPNPQSPVGAISLANEDAAPDGARTSSSVWFYKDVAPMALPAVQREAASFANDQFSMTNCQSNRSDFHAFRNAFVPRRADKIGSYFCPESGAARQCKANSAALCRAPLRFIMGGFAN